MRHEYAVFGAYSLHIRIFGAVCGRDEGGDFPHRCMRGWKRPGRRCRARRAGAGIDGASGADRGAERRREGRIMAVLVGAAFVLGG